MTRAEKIKKIRELLEAQGYKEAGQEEKDHTGVIDLLADIMLYCHSLDFDFDEIVDRASVHFEDEKDQPLDDELTL